MREFVFNGQPSRVVFGPGSLIHMEREIEHLGARRALVLSTPEQAQQAQMVADRLGSRAAGIFPRAVMHVPIETAREALFENAVACDFLAAQRELENLQKEISKYVGATIELGRVPTADDLAAAGGGGCCGGGGGGGGGGCCS